jgi:hypothetical protein
VIKLGEEPAITLVSYRSEDKRKCRLFRLGRESSFHAHHRGGERWPWNARYLAISDVLDDITDLFLLVACEAVRLPAHVAVVRHAERRARSVHTSRKLRNCPHDGRLEAESLQRAFARDLVRSLNESSRDRDRLLCGRLHKKRALFRC